MTLPYGYVKSTIQKIVGLKGSRHRSEIQYHVHLTLTVDGQPWDVAVNVGTNDSDDLLTYKLAYDFHHPITQTLAKAPLGFTELTGQAALPALDFMRSDVLAETGAWRRSDVMDGSEHAEPIASMLRLFNQAMANGSPIYVFGRRYTGNDPNGIHDTHMNQGSSGTHFRHNPGDDSTDHNDIWQDGALLADLGDKGWAAYFAAFEQQGVPTDALGNPNAGAGPIDR
jgi:uncharacterized protein YukJ